MQRALRKLTRGRTCLTIAHRLSTVTGADRIIVLDQGRIVEEGSHKELLARQGLYYKMFQTLSTPELAV
jgi:ABC-type multidrug transport system fused ATPase/permease subunit